MNLSSESRTRIQNMQSEIANTYCIVFAPKYLEKVFYKTKNAEGERCLEICPMQ